MKNEALKLSAEFDKRFTSMNGVDVPERVSVPRDEWRALHTSIKQALAAPVQEFVADELVHARLKAQLWKNEAIVWKNAYDVERGFSEQDKGAHYDPPEMLSDEELVLHYNTSGGHLNSLRALEAAVLKKIQGVQPSIDCNQSLESKPAAQPAVPLTDEQIYAIGKELGMKCRLGGNPSIDLDYARAIEAHHGITKGQS